MLGGVTVNLLLAMVIYAMILFTWGDEYLKTENASFGIECSAFAKELGFQNGDKILTVDGVYYESFMDLPQAILIFWSHQSEPRAKWRSDNSSTS
jgi:regulator of sigma E protease